MPRFPHHAIAYCLASRRAPAGGLDHVVFYDKPFLKFERLLETYLAFAPRGFQSFQMAMPLWLQGEAVSEEPAARRARRSSLGDFDHGRLLFCRASPEPRGVGVLSLAVRRGGGADHGRRRRMGDDVGGDRATATVSRSPQEIHFPHSLGLLYSAFTYYTGFKVNSGEYKVMGLAPYGEPKYANLILDNI